MRYYFSSNDHEYKFELIKKGKEFLLIDEDNNQVQAQVKSIGEKKYYSLDGTKWTRLRELSHTGKMIFTNQSYHLYKGFKPSSLFDEAGGGLITQIPGKVIKVDCKEGEEVQQGQTLMILEAMKMENEIKSNLDGVVKAIYIEEGQSLEAGTLMIEVEEKV